MVDYAQKGKPPAAAHVVSFRGSGRGGAGNRPAAEVEARLVAQASRNAQVNARIPGGVSTGISMSAEGAGGIQLSPAPAGSQPLRVGGTITKPTQTVHVQAVKPDRAVQAGISGMVILEATIGTDGSVTEAKVLRSIPLLDEAAVAAVKQWKFTPTLLNGVPVPVIMTVTVNFPQ
jgi:protein TonB